MEHELFVGKSGQEIKDHLFSLIGRKDRRGQKNTPPRYGKTIEEIKASILRIIEEEKALGKVMPAYGTNVEEEQSEEMPRKKATEKTSEKDDSEATPLPKKRTIKKKEVIAPAHTHIPLTPFHFPTGHIRFLVNMDVISCETVDTMTVQTQNKKNYAYNPITELYHQVGKDGKLGGGVEEI